MTMKFPPRREKRTIETDMMHDVADRTMGIHDTSPIVVWTGESRLGKTTTKEWLTDRINKAFASDNPAAFKAAHYQATEIGPWPGTDKKAMCAFHNGILGTLDEGLKRRLKADGLAELIVKSLKKRRIEMVFVDEAGLYSITAIRGLVAIRDRAVEEDHRLTLVLIGMDDLPVKLEAVPQIAGRVHEWCYFKPYDLEETVNLVTQISDLWANADRADIEVSRQIQFIHQITRGVAGQIVPFIRKVEQAVGSLEEPLSVSMLKAVHLRTLNGRRRAQQAARNNYVSPTPAPRAKTPTKPNATGKPKKKTP